MWRNPISVEGKLANADCDLKEDKQFKKDYPGACTISTEQGVAVALPIYFATQRHLYKECVNTNLIDRFRFINPHPISHNPKVHSAEKATIVGKRLIGSSTNQLVFVPCNVGFHWILMVVDPHKEKEYVLDSLSNNYHFDEWKSIMEMAMKMFNMSIGKRGRQSILWEVIKFTEGFYSKREIDEVRTEWCGVVQDFID